MNFRDEYKKSAEKFDPDEQALRRMTQNVLEMTKRSGRDGGARWTVLKKISVIGGAAAACAIVTLSAVTLLSHLRGVTTDSMNGEVGMERAEDRANDELGDRSSAADISGITGDINDKAPGDTECFPDDVFEDDCDVETAEIMLSGSASDDSSNEGGAQPTNGEGYSDGLDVVTGGGIGDYPSGAADGLTGDAFMDGETLPEEEPGLGGAVSEVGNDYGVVNHGANTVTESDYDEDAEIMSEDVDCFEDAATEDMQESADEAQPAAGNNDIMKDHVKNIRFSNDLSVMYYDGMVYIHGVLPEEEPEFSPAECVSNYSGGIKRYFDICRPVLEGSPDTSVIYLFEQGDISPFAVYRLPQR